MDELCWSSLDIVVDGHSSTELLVVLPISWVWISSVVNVGPDKVVADQVVESTMLLVVASAPVGVSPSWSSVVELLLGWVAKVEKIDGDGVVLEAV